MSSSSEPGCSTPENTTKELKWTPLKPSDDFPSCKVGNTQYAKDEMYLQAIQNVWNVNESHDYEIEKAAFTYSDDEDVPLYGHLIRRSCGGRGGGINKKTGAKMPGMLLFHTAAGPQDVFLFYKAYQLLQEFDGVVMICDLMSDQTGWGWDSDRSRYNTVMPTLLENDMALLTSRSLAAIDALLRKRNDDVVVVDSKRLAAIGWCLGGKPILALGTAATTTPPKTTIHECAITAMCTFHGVFGPPPPSSSTTITKGKEGNGEGAEICIFNGMKDSFVAKEDLDSAKQRLEACGNKPVTLYQLPDAKHGFSNPAQGHNDNPSFNYVEAAANKGWEETIALLHRRLLC